MDLEHFLKEPIFIHQGTDMVEMKTRVEKEEHPFVFVQKEDGMYAIASIALIVETAEELLELPSASEYISQVTSIPQSEAMSHSLEVLSQEVTMVTTDVGQRYLCRDDYLLYMMISGRDTDISWIRTLLSSIPKGLMTVDLSFRAVNFNSEALRMLNTSVIDIQSLHLDELFGKARFEQILQTKGPLLNQVIGIPSKGTTLLVDFAPLTMNHEVSGFALVLQDLPTVESMAMELYSVKRLNQDLQAILSTIYDEIIVVDRNGRIVRASEHYIASQWSQPPAKLIGKHILDFKAKDDVFYRTIIEVQKTGQKISLMHNGPEPILVVGNPIFRNSGKLDRIVMASRDLTEVTRLRNELEKTKKQGESYRHQLEVLRESPQLVSTGNLVHASQSMVQVLEEVSRVAPFTTSVLLIGESGVGKEVIADMIHNSSERRSGPFIKINCGAIPETLLESELFGYEKGAFSGANSQGKVGLFIKADGGSLFLDEISELPLALQVKLLRAIQDREVYPIGGTTPIKFDVRIIAASNRPLEKLVEEGNFRRDLFYRINVYPIEIPPLRERREDIAVLANYYLNQFNRTYNRNMRFSSSAIDLLEAYPFPGNVRELQNIVQRVAIKSDGDIVDVSSVERVLLSASPFEVQNNRRFTTLMPLNEAVRQVEDELISLAMEKYHSTTEAAKALGVNQSTISRKYRRLMKQSNQEEFHED